MTLTVLALDLSVKSTGFALWSDGQAKPVCGTWELAGGIAHAAKAFVRLHRHLKDVYGLAPIDLIAFEDPLPPHAVHGQTSIDVLKASAGLAAHVQSFSEAMGIRCCAVNQSTWRRHFLGAMPRGVKTADYKHMAMTNAASSASRLSSTTRPRRAACSITSSASRASLPRGARASCSAR
jgi:hypothetical protein